MANTKQDFFECLRCNINTNTRGSMCPCPRGSCEARIVGTLTKVTTTTLDKVLTERQKDWNKSKFA